MFKQKTHKVEESDWLRLIKTQIGISIKIYNQDLMTHKTPNTVIGHTHITVNPVSLVYLLLRTHALMLCQLNRLK